LGKEIMTSPTNDPSLSRLLQEWRVQPPADPNFRPGVWQRIRRRSAETWSSYLQARLGALAVLAVSVAGWAGHAAGRAELDSLRDAMVTAYLVELDPRVHAAMPTVHP
jgi:hypothetical protein